MVLKKSEVSKKPRDAEKPTPTSFPIVRGIQEESGFGKTQAEIKEIVPTEQVFQKRPEKYWAL